MKRSAVQNHDYNLAKESSTRLSHALMIAGIPSITPAISHAREAGSSVIGVSVAEMRDVISGWSAKRTILGQAVYNDKDERVGSIDDIVIAPDKAVSYAITGSRA